MESTSNIEFKAMLERCYADWSTPLNHPEKWYADDVLVFDLIPPFPPYRGRDRYVASALKEFYEKMTSVTFTAKEVLRIVCIDDMALTEVIVHGSTQPKVGEQMEMDIRQTQVWVKRDGKWLIIHEHNSVPMPAPQQ